MFIIRGGNRLEEFKGIEIEILTSISIPNSGEYYIDALFKYGINDANLSAVNTSINIMEYFPLEGTDSAQNILATHFTYPLNTDDLRVANKVIERIKDNKSSISNLMFAKAVDIALEEKLIEEAALIFRLQGELIHRVGQIADICER